MGSFDFVNEENFEGKNVPRITIEIENADKERKQTESLLIQASGTAPGLS